MPLVLKADPTWWHCDPGHSSASPKTSFLQIRMPKLTLLTLHTPSGTSEDVESLQKYKKKPQKLREELNTHVNYQNNS